MKKLNVYKVTFSTKEKVKKNPKNLETYPTLTTFGLTIGYPPYALVTSTDIFYALVKTMCNFDEITKDLKVEEGYEIDDIKGIELYRDEEVFV